MSLASISMAEAAKEKGMARVDAAADPIWKETMLECVRLVCLRMARFTADDVFELASEMGVEHTTGDKRAFGPVMRRAATRGWCVKAAVAAEMSRRPELHRSPIQVWDSMIYGESES